MSKSELITDPSAAKAELELDQPATKREVLTAIKNHHLGNVHPMFANLAQTLQQNFGRMEKQRDQIAVIFNGLVDFLEQEGFRVGKDGRVRLNQQEFQAFLKKRAEKASVQPPPGTRPS